MKSKQIRKELKQFFPLLSLKNIIITDEEYEDIRLHELQESIIDIPIVAGLDCDDYSRELWHHIRKLHPHWPVGMCLMRKVAGVSTNHAMVIGICGEEVYIIEPQAVWDIGIPGMSKIWLMKKKQDSFYFVFI